MSRAAILTKSPMVGSLHLRVGGKPVPHLRHKMRTASCENRRLTWRHCRSKAVSLSSFVRMAAIISVLENRRCIAYSSFVMGEDCNGSDQDIIGVGVGEEGER
jgi:hypothetical protein